MRFRSEAGYPGQRDDELKAKSVASQEQQMLDKVVPHWTGDEKTVEAHYGIY